MSDLIQTIIQNVQQALAEDLGGSIDLAADITAQLIPAEHHIKAQIITREDMVMAGAEWVNQTFAELDNSIEIDWQCKDGDRLTANQPLCYLSGLARPLLTGERTALNFLQTLSATATQAAKYTRLLAKSDTKILDTRKTLPGLRLAQKYAIRCGGGQNHRIGLFDAFLIKENHILACGSIKQAVQQANTIKPNAIVEVEVESLAELQQALDAKANIIMLDNFTLDDVRQAVKFTCGRAKLEVSGNITDDRLAELAQTGVDYISSGALTKNIQAIDLSFRVLGR